MVNSGAARTRVCCVCDLGQYVFVSKRRVGDDVSDDECLSLVDYSLLCGEVSI